MTREEIADRIRKINDAIWQLSSDMCLNVETAREYGDAIDEIQESGRSMRNALTLI